MANKPDPLWMRFGAELHRIRSSSGKTQTELGRGALISKSLVSGFERGLRTPKRHQAETLDTVLSTNGTLARLWEELAGQREVPDWFRDALLMERRAAEIREYQSVLIPGLLQTPAYARTLIRSWRMRDAPDHIEQVVSARAERLESLKEKRPLLWFVVDEVAVSRVIGGEMIMREQLDHIARLVADGTVRFQVIPRMPVHPGLCPPFRLMTFDDTQTLVYAEHALGGESIDAPESVREISTVFGSMQAAAIPPDESLTLIQEAYGGNNG